MTKPIIVAVDGSALAELAIPHAVDLARKLGAPIVLARVHTPLFANPVQSFAPVAPPSPEIAQEIQVVARKWLDERAARLRAAAGVPVSVDFRVGQPVDELVASAHDSGAFAIVCTTHGAGGWAPEWIGSICDGVIRHATCPVLAFGRAAVSRPVGIRKILVPLDGTAEAECALPEATMLARTLGAQIELFRVVAPAWIGELVLMQMPEPSDRFDVDGFAADTKAGLDCVAADLRDLGIDASAVVVAAHNATRAVLRRVEEVNPDLLVVVPSVRGMSRLLVPSLADRVLRASGRPTLFVHAARRHLGSWRNMISGSASAAG